MNISVVDALGVCIQAINIGQSRGAYTLDQAAKLVSYVEILSKAQIQLNKGGPLQIDGVVSAYDIVRSAIEVAQSKGSYVLADVPKITGSFASLDKAKETVLRASGSAGSASAAVTVPITEQSHLTGEGGGKKKKKSRKGKEKAE